MYKLSWMVCCILLFILYTFAVKVWIKPAGHEHPVIVTRSNFNNL